MAAFKIASKNRYLAKKDQSSGLIKKNIVIQKAEPNGLDHHVVILFDGEYLHLFSLALVVRLKRSRDLEAEIVVKAEELECKSIGDGAIDVIDRLIVKLTMTLNPRFKIVRYQQLSSILFSNAPR
jgi:hypothetical protein